jgi:hypothetical protein
MGRLGAWPKRIWLRICAMRNHRAT